MLIPFQVLLTGMGNILQGLALSGDKKHAELRMIYESIGFMTNLVEKIRGKTC